MLSDAERFVADNETEANVKRVLEVIRRARRKGIRHSMLTNGTTFIRSPERKDILHTLIEAERVSVRQQPVAAKKVTIYTYVR